MTPIPLGDDTLSAAGCSLYERILERAEEILDCQFGQWYISVYTRNAEEIAVESFAKLFKNGRSQAVRLPKAFRFEGTEVRIRKQGEKVILEPVKKSKWPEGFWDIFTPDPQFETPEPLASKDFQLD